MNRRERRAAKAQGAAKTAAPPTFAEASRPRELFDRAMAFFQAGDATAAEVACRQLLAADSKSAGALHLLGLIALQSGQLDAAVGHISRAIEIDGRSPDFHYNIGLAYGMLGRFEQSAAHTLSAIRLDPNYPNAHLNLANALLAQGERESALRNYQRAAELNPNSAAAHYNIGNMRIAAGDFDAAIPHYERALLTDPGHADARLNLARALLAGGKIDQAIAQYQQAVASDPSAAGTHKELGVALRERGKLEAAAVSLQTAIRAAPSDPDAHAYLGAVLLSLGNSNEAARFTRQALVLNPRLVLAAQTLARIQMAAGEYAVALGHLNQLWGIDQSPTTKALLLSCLKNIHFDSPTPDVCDLVVRSLTEPWGRPSDVSLLAATLIKLDPKLRAAIERATAARPRLPSEAELTGEQRLSTLVDHPLLVPLLEATPIPSPELEKFLTACRATLLEQASASAQDNADLLKFHCALARQCFINEYVYTLSEQERRKVEDLRASVARALEAGAPIHPTQIAALAAYLPLHEVPHSDRLRERKWPPSIDGLLTQQIREPRRERELAEGLRQLTSIDDGVSQMVRGQYEENPYPRWVNVSILLEPTDFAAFWRSHFPNAPIVERKTPEKYEILIAGCGTGRQVVETARCFPAARILAVDFSRASLAFAMRKSEELGLKNVEFAQADILKIGSVGRTFDVIYSDGVLHHLGDPLAGWRELIAILRPGGAMHISLYSELARTQIVEAQRLAAGQGYSGLPDEIRDFRQQLLNADAGTPLALVGGIPDVYSLSECRDLLFHRHERRFDIPQIGRFLAEAGLEFAGFDVEEKVSRRYAARFPGASAADLGNWDEFEREHPLTFVGMYQFWLRKPPA